MQPNPPFQPGDRFPVGTNPRAVVKNHRERGPKRYHFKLSDIAEASGAPLSTVRRAATRARGCAPRLDPANLSSVVDFVLAERARREGVRGGS